ncbi:MAG: glycosyltransferase family 4 protein [Sulfuricella sp.]
MPSNSTSHASDKKICYQINFSEVLGGAEIYTHFFSKALLAKGWETVLYVNKNVTFWSDMDLTGVELIPLAHKEDILTALPEKRSLFVTHTPVSGAVANMLRQNHLLAGIIHHPIYGGNGEPYRAYQLLFAVSRYVISTLDAANITHYYPHPLYGVADLDRLKKPDDTPITATPMYEWDKRKLRDRLLSIAYPIFWAVKPTRHFTKREGLTLGFVSRIAPAKQFPEMFEILAPILLKFPQVHLEFFGSGVGYSPVKKLKKSLAPIRQQVRFWGPQTNLHKVYRSMDFLMAGLPEREAMGLNILEAQFCGTPVLAINAPPFNEIVRDGGTGFLYTDPRQDGGKNFEALLGKLTASPAFPNPLEETQHLGFFSFNAFAERVEKALSTMPVTLNN